MSSPETIRLQNLTPNMNLSVMLHLLVPAARGSMKRGPALMPILIPAGQFYDVCARLKLTVREARDLCARSPEVLAAEKRGRLRIMEFPPPAAPVVVPEPVVSVPVPEEPVEVPASTLASAPPTSPAEEAAPTEPRGREPSMDWAEEELRAYARERNIDLGRARSKTAVLRAVRGIK